MSKLIEWLEQNTRPAPPTFTVKELAAKLDVDQSLITLWRQGLRKPGKRKLVKVSKLTGIEIKDLL